MSRGTGGIGNAIRSVESARMIGELRDKLDKQQSKNVSGIGAARNHRYTQGY
jgi:hypothetical protein